MDPFAALADPVRRELLHTLAGGPARVVDLASTQSISRPAVSKHLRLLSEAGLVSATDHGRERHYALTPAGLAPVRVLLDALSPRARFPQSALDALDLEVRRTVRDHRSEPASAPEPAPTEETA